MLLVHLLILQTLSQPTDAGTIKLQSEEMWYRKDFSGNKTTFLWGLFTFTDY